MAYTTEQVRSIVLAESIARAEADRELFSEFSVPTEDVDQHLNRRCAELLEDPLAEQLLPQARAFMNMLAAREGVTQHLMLEQLQTGVALLMSCVGDSAQEAMIVKSFPQQFKSEKDAERMRQFCEAVIQGDKVSVLKALSQLLISASVELLFTELPPVPKRDYKIPTD